MSHPSSVCVCVCVCVCGYLSVWECICVCWVAGLIWSQLFLSIPVLLGMDRQTTYGKSDNFLTACVIVFTACVCVCAVCVYVCVCVIPDCG